MTIAWEQQSTYSWFDTERMEQQAVNLAPKAQVSLSLAKDTVYVGSKEILEQTSSVSPEVSSEGENPTVYTAQQTYELGGGQTVTLNWRYDSYGSIEVEGNEVAFPYLELSQPELVDVTVTDRPDVIIPNKEAAVYEVTARFKQTLMPKNVAEGGPQSLEYVVKYMAVQEVKLVKVAYRKSWVWNTPHDNIILAWAPIVYRDRTYSDGKTYTDTFSGSFMFKSLSPSVLGGNVDDYTVGAEFNWDGKRIVYHPRHEADRDSIFIATISIGVTSLAEMEDVKIRYQTYQTIPPGDWEKYGQNGLYDEGVNITSTDGVEFVGADSVSTKASGWYAYGITYYMNIFARYQNSIPPLRVALVAMQVTLEMPDQFLVLDGKMINYLEFRGEPITTIRTDDITMPNGAPARIYTLEGRQHFLDKNFYVAAIDTVYQFAPNASTPSSAPAFAPAARKRPEQPQAANVPPYRSNSVSFGKAPKGLPVPPVTVNGRVYYPE